MDLIGLVIAGQGVYDQINAEAPGHFTLASAAGERRSIRPGRSPVMGPDNNGRNAIPTTPGACGFDPERTAFVTARIAVEQVKGLSQNMIFSDRGQRRDIKGARDHPQGFCIGRSRQGGTRCVAVLRVKEDGAAVIQIILNVPEGLS